MPTAEPFGGYDAFSPSPSTGYIFYLPFNVLHMILRELPPPSRVAFALSCKTVFAILSSAPTIRNLNQQKLIQDLQQRETDCPDNFLCFGCLRLCPWKPTNRLSWHEQAHDNCGDTVQCTSMEYRARKRGDVPHRRFEGEGFALRCIFSPTTVHALAWRPRVNGPAISFSEARQVMNRHRLGPAFGLPLESLEKQFYCERRLTLEASEVTTDHFLLQQLAHGRRPITRYMKNRIIESAGPEPAVMLGLDGQPSSSAGLWKFTHEYKAKIIGDELFISRSHRITGPPVADWQFAKLLCDLALPICLHRFSRIKPAGYPNIQLPDWTRIYPRVNTYLPPLKCIPSAYFRTREPVVVSCNICFTDYLLYIYQGEQQWGLELMTYHRLGSCMSPDDPVWSSLTNLDAYPLETSWNLPSRHHSKYGPGNVKRHWDETEGPVRKLQTAWVSGDQDSFPFHWNGLICDWERTSCRRKGPYPRMID